MTDTAKKIIGIFVLIAFIAIAVFYSVYNTTSVKVPTGTVGAAAGNLNNHGLFNESDGKVYFSNVYDEGALYVMNPDQSDIKKVYNLNVKYINACADFLFFYGDTIPKSTGLGSVVSKPGMYMVKKNGSRLKSLTKETSQNMLLVDNNIYYQHYTKTEGTTFHKLDLKTGESTELLNYMINPSSYNGGLIYFNGMYDDHHLYTYNIATGEVTDVWGGDIWNPIYQDGYIYYMDVLNNYRLCRYSLSENVIEILTKDRIDTFNIYNGIIFYSKSSATNPKLMRMLADGSGMETIAEGVYSDINITSTYTYFKDFNNEYAYYYTSTYGSPNVSEFTAARSVVFENMKK